MVDVNRCSNVHLHKNDIKSTKIFEIMYICVINCSYIHIVVTLITGVTKGGAGRTQDLPNPATKIAKIEIL